MSTLTGTAYSMEAGMHPFVAVMMGVITGTFGGVLGDVICNEVPSLFVPSPLNATCSFAGAWVYLGVLHFAIPERYALVTGIVMIVLFRLAAEFETGKLPTLAKKSHWSHHEAPQAFREGGAGPEGQWSQRLA